MSAVGKHSQPYPWEQRKLGETFLFKKNNTFSRSELSFENGYVKNIHYGDILVKYNEYLNVHNNSNIPFVTQNIPSNFSSSYLQDGDIVMADTAEDETVGKSTEISSLSSNDRVLAGLHTIPLSPKQKFGSGFLGFYLNSNSYHDKLRPLMQGIKVTSISKKNLKNTILQFPKELEEQKRIGKLFIKLNRTITLHEEQHRRLEQLKKALLQKMFADETGYPALRFKGFAEKWDQRKFSELYSKNVERNSTNEFNFDKTISIAKMRYNSEGNGASKKSLQNYKVIRIGDVAFEGHTNKEFQYGRFVVNSLGNGIMSPRFAVLRPIRPTVVNFWKYYLYNERSMNRILVRATKAGTMMNELVYSDLAKEKIKVPIEKEQLEIGNLFSIVDKTITLHDKKIQYLKQLKRGLLQKMFV